MGRSRLYSATHVRQWADTVYECFCIPEYDCYSMLDSIIVFVVSLLIGALGLHIGASVIAGVSDYTHAVVTALIGALVWSIVGLFFGWIPFLGPIIVLFAYLTIIKWRYPGGWIDAAGITLVAWVAVIIVLYILAIAEITTFGAAGIPGT